MRMQCYDDDDDEDISLGHSLRFLLLHEDSRKSRTGVLELVEHVSLIGRSFSPGLFHLQQGFEGERLEKGE